MQSCGLTMSLSRYFIDVNHICSTGASLLLRYTFCSIPSPTQDHPFEFFGGPRFRWLHGTRGLPTFILVCFWRMGNLHNYFWNLTLRLHKFKGFIDEYYYFFREINFRRYLKWNRTKEKLKSQTYYTQVCTLIVAIRDHWLKNPTCCSFRCRINLGLVVLLYLLKAILI